MNLKYTQVYNIKTSVDKPSLPSSSSSSFWALAYQIPIGFNEYLPLIVSSVEKKRTRKENPKPSSSTLSLKSHKKIQKRLKKS